MKERVEEDLEQFINTWEGPTPLREACAYALLAPGKRFRPILVHQMAATLPERRDVRLPAIAVELFHTASLIADDLPCMDDDSERRGRPSLHEKYGESTALLSTYAMISAGYSCVAKASEGFSAEVGRLATLAVSKNTGSAGATGGQYWDLFAPQQNLEEMIAMKTGSLFELSFVLGWLFGGGEPTLLPIVEAAAQHFGMAFQIRDDLLDFEEDPPERNYAHLFGIEGAKARFAQEKEAYGHCLEQLGIKLELALAEVP